MWSIIFINEETSVCMEVSKETNVPENIGVFELEEGQSTFCPRYKLKNNIIFDKYPEKSDEEVAIYLQQLEVEKALEIESVLKNN